METIIKIPKNVLYLIHITNNDYKDENHNLNWTELKPSGNDQYPGVYFTLITTDNRLSEELYPGMNCLIFSRNLLKQFNYHINVTDNNGFISEGNTFFPCNLKKAVEKIKENVSLPIDEQNINYQRMNEVVFHDPISMKYLCMDIPTKISNDFLPDYPIENKVKPDTSLLPFYCFAQQEEKNRLKSSLSFFKKMAMFCNIDKKYTSKNKIIKKIKKNANFLQSHRYKQNIKLLKYMCKNSKFNNKSKIKNKKIKKNMTRKYN